MTATPAVNPEHTEPGQVLDTGEPNLFLIRPGEPGWSEYEPEQYEPEQYEPGPPYQPSERPKRARKSRPQKKSRRKPAEESAGDRWIAFVERLVQRFRLRRKRRWK